MSSRCSETGRSTARHTRTSLPLVALCSTGYLPAYLLPAVVGRVPGDLEVTPTQAGAVGSALLLASASAGLLLAGRVRTIGSARLARVGLALLVLGCAVAAVASAGQLPLLVLGCVLGGFGTGTVAAVAGVGVAATGQSHRLAALGLLAASGTAGALFLSLPRLGGGHALPFAALAAYGAVTWCTLGGLPEPGAVSPTHSHPLPHRAAGGVLAAGMMLWSMAQNALWGISGQIGLHRAGLSESVLGLVLATALGGGLLGVAAAAALGSRPRKALPIGLGTAAIGLCVAGAGSAHAPTPFAAGEVLWNTLYPLVLTYLIGVAAALDPRGRWAVLAGAASSLGVACGPVVGAALAATAGFPATGLLLGSLLAAVALPLAAVARRTGETASPAGAPAAEPTAGATIPRQRSVGPVGGAGTGIAVAMTPLAAP
ncbi:MFS transporter [Kitasatospora sp. McL0602]|uniref:MFS transporter n=1 Tax=Kitasatospora sp. McL0602 TaxID=3439530 RepID=UPI003F8C9A5D